jgi:hypothetical protein
MGAVTGGELQKKPAVEWGWVKAGVGDKSLMVIGAQMGLVFESADDVTLGLEGSTRHESTAARLPW